MLSRSSDHLQNCCRPGSDIAVQVPIVVVVGKGGHGVVLGEWCTYGEEVRRRYIQSMKCQFYQECFWAPFFWGSQVCVTWSICGPQVFSTNEFGDGPVSNPSALLCEKFQRGGRVMDGASGLQLIQWIQDWFNFKLWVFSNQNQLEVWLFLAQTCWDTPDFMLNRLKKKHMLPVFNWKNLLYRYVQSLGMFLGCVHTGRKHPCRLKVKFVKSDSPEVLDTTINDQRRILTRWVISICLRCPPWPSGPYLSLDVSDPVTMDLRFVY